MKTLKLSRRAVLRGLGGVAVALPFLEIMGERDRLAFAQARTLPKRYLVCFGGQSLAADRDPLGSNLVVPNMLGPNYDLKAALAPLAMHGNVKNEITVVSGLEIPTATTATMPVPSGGRAVGFHIHSLSPLFSGVRSRDNDNHNVMGVTSDQVVADQLGMGTTFRSINYRVQAEWYLSVSAPYGRDVMSYRRDMGGALRGVPATVSPQQAYRSLFTGFMPTNPADAARAAALLRQRRSVLDLVSMNTARLIPRLGRADQQRIQRHLDEIRDLERRLAAVAPTAMNACQMLPDPGMDPPIGANQPNVGGENQYVEGSGYSNEEARARVMCDLMAMAFTCDLTRVGTLMFTMAQSHLNAFPLTGDRFDFHELGHSSNTAALSRGIAWHMKHFGYLVAKLRDTMEMGQSILANSAILFLWEGGHGRDPEGSRDHSTHSTENMACLIAGRAGGLQPGRHVAATGRHPVHVINTAMRAVGVSADLGEVTGTIPALLGM